MTSQLKASVLSNPTQAPAPSRRSDCEDSQALSSKPNFMKQQPAVSQTLNRIREMEPSIGAFTYIAQDPDAETEAELLARPLRALPIAVKDIIDTLDMPTCYGSRIYEGHRPVMDAAIVTALRKAGAFIVGKTTTTEFATHPPTATRNPRNAAHTPGGSSAGSAAAVAAGLVPIALGTQTLGSIIRPASYCGVVGFMPTHGWFPLSGIKGLASSLDTLGFLAADVAVARRVYTALVPTDAGLRAKRPRLLFSREPNWHLATDDAQTAILSCIAVLREKGFSVVEGLLPDGFEALTEAAEVIHDYEMCLSLAPDLQIGRDRMDATLVTRIDRAGRWNKADYRSALAVTETQRKALGTFFESFDAILCLSAPSDAPRGLSSTGNPAMNSAWTALHLPCLSVPVMTSSAGLPLGLQIIGASRQEFRLLDIGAQVEWAMTPTG